MRSQGIVIAALLTLMLTTSCGPTGKDDVVVLSPTRSISTESASGGDAAKYWGWYVDANHDDTWDGDAVEKEFEKRGSVFLPDSCWLRADLIDSIVKVEGLRSGNFVATRAFKLEKANLSVTGFLANDQITWVIEDKANHKQCVPEPMASYDPEKVPDELTVFGDGDTLEILDRDTFKPAGKLRLHRHME